MPDSAGGQGLSCACVCDALHRTNTTVRCSGSIPLSFGANARISIRTGFFAYDSRAYGLMRRLGGAGSGVPRGLPRGAPWS